MSQVAQQLGGALRPGATDVGAVLIPGHRRAAHRADRGQQIGLRSPGPLLFYHRYDLRDDLSRLLDHHGVPDADILFSDEILVVKGGVGHRSTRQTDRGNYRLRRQHAGPAHLDHDVLHQAFLLLRRILIGRRPAGKFRRLSKYITLR